MVAFPALAAFAAFSFLVEPGRLVVRKVSVKSGKWPKATRPLRVVVIADLHVGAPHVGLRAIERIVEKTNRLHPGVVVLLGDYVIRRVLFGSFVRPREIAKRLGGLKAPLGVIAVLGNHDWWYDGRHVWRELKKAGIVVLENDVHAINAGGGRVWFAGLADSTTRSPDPRGTVAKVPDGEPVIVLSHDPAVFPAVPKRAILTLAGHTHGGQVNLPFLNPLATPGRHLRHKYGLIREGGKLMYVSSGIGTSVLPARFNMPPELVLVTFKSALPRQDRS
jgi:hypothetical protein